ncbi:MAG: DUF456 domain-containing protein [Deltaproteobacteria bacterium]|nr:DUF456 domain-containing protein [Deltaproteobacteria bacterium]
MDAVLAVLFIVLLLASLILHVFGLPANWLVLALAGLWKWSHPDMDASVPFFIGLSVLALAGEGIEFAATIWGGRRYGSTGRGNLGAIVGAIVGAVFGAPFFFGLGALAGALLGAYGGCLLVEILHGRDMESARQAAKGAMFGKFLGLAAKFGLGVTMVWMIVPRV